MHGHYSHAFHGQVWVVPCEGAPRLFLTAVAVLTKINRPFLSPPTFAFSTSGQPSCPRVAFIQAASQHVVIELPKSPSVSLTAVLSYVAEHRSHMAQIGLPWSYGVDNFAAGCVLAELSLMRPLFCYELTTDREHLAMVERILGRFGSTFASAVEAKYPGTFAIGDKVSVVFPSRGSSVTWESHGEAMLRLARAHPLSVSQSLSPSHSCACTDQILCRL